MVLYCDHTEELLNEIRHLSATDDISNKIKNSVEFIVDLTLDVLLIDDEHAPIIGEYTTWYNQTYIQKASNVCRWLGEVSRYSRTHPARVLFMSYMYDKLDNFKIPGGSFDIEDVYTLVLQTIERTTHDFLIASTLIKIHYDNFTINGQLNNKQPKITDIIDMYMFIIDKLPINIRVLFDDTYKQLGYINYELESMAGVISSNAGVKIQNIINVLNNCFDVHNKLFDLVGNINKNINELHDEIYLQYQNNRKDL